MNINEILDDIKSKLTGDPQKDGPFLKSQSEKYKEHEDYEQLNRELGKLLFRISYDDYYGNMSAFLSQENKSVDEQLENVRKRYKNLNYTAGLEILEKIIRNNMLSWLETDEITYKSFGTPLEYAVYIQTFSPDKEIRSVNCNLSEVYYLYGIGLSRKQRYDEAKKALETALEFNPVDADIILEYLEIMKSTQKFDDFRKYCDRALRFAVKKVQLGRAYFNYAFYFAENHELEKAAKMLEMSRIFCDDDIIETEAEYIAGCMGSKPRMHSAKELAEFLESESIQPGPSAVVVQSAYKMGQDASRELDYKLAKYFYEVILELTENDDIRDIVEDLDRTIKDLEQNS
ncbi:MAG: tetratricopeptide repeat protein [Porcipelethomonas sp.]